MFFVSVYDQIEIRPQKNLLSLTFIKKYYLIDKNSCDENWNFKN